MMLQRSMQHWGMCLPNQEKPYDLVVVGAGIAGLAIAEIFSRSGQKVALLEKNSKVCMESSGAHHEWFHFGSLYSIFLNNQFMRTLVGGIDDLLLYYRSFPGMNIDISAQGKLEFPEKAEAWIRDNPIEYIVAARNDPDFDLKTFKSTKNYLKKCFFLLTWEMAIKQFISRHQRFHKFDWRKGQASAWVPKAGWLDYSTKMTSRVTDLDADLDRNTHFLVNGFDRPMDAIAMIRSLLRGFLSNGGALFLDHDVERVEKSQQKDCIGIESSNGEVLYAKKVVFTSGKGLDRFVGNDMKLKVVTSPLLVVYPEVCRQNFVRLTPFMNNTVNHLSHSVDGERYSVIGGGYYADPNDASAVEKTRNDLISMAKSVFSKVKEAELVETYIGYKSELITSGTERNYQYHLSEIAENIYVAIPGKFSLAFSLAVNTYKKLVGSNPSVQSSYNRDINVSAYTGLIKHKRIVSEFLSCKAAAAKNTSQ